MNKKLVALAVAGALGAPLLAQAQTASVVLYGSVRGAVVSTKTDNVGRSNAVNSISSRLGVRAEDGIGNGMTGFAHYEFGINEDNIGSLTGNPNATGNPLLGIREAWVGLRGGFGEVKLGAGLTPWDDVMGMNHNSIVGEYNNINAVYFGNGFANYNVGTGISNAFAFDARYGNSISYRTPELGPVSVRTQYAFLNEGNTGRKATGWDTAAIAGFGPVKVGLAYAKHTNFNTGTTYFNANNILLTAVGNFGMLDVNAGFETAKYTNLHSGLGDAKYKGVVAGIGANFGPTKVGIDYSQRDNGITTACGVGQNLCSNELGGGKLYTLYVNQNMSKRTIGYFWVSQNKPETGNKSTQLAVALRHNF